MTRLRQGSGAAGPPRQGYLRASAPDLLLAIVAAARRITEVRSESVPEKALERAAAARLERRSFEDALRSGEAPRVIAECKRRSPSRGVLREDYRPAEHVAAYESAGASAISVLTEPTFFDGAVDHLGEVRAAVTLPILRKDFIVTRYQVLEAVASGADAVLLIVSALSPKDLRERLRDAEQCGLSALVEVHDEEEMGRAVDAGTRIVGVNSRNLRTLDVDPGVHDRLAAKLPAGVVAVAESGLRSRSDLDRLENAGYHAFLVGERLIAEPDPGAALKALRSLS